MHSLFDLHGKVALVTGGSSGIGLAIARGCAEHGARVVVASNEPERCKAVEAALCADGHDALGLGCDVASKDELAALVDAAVARYGRIDILICCAGVAPHMGPLGSASDADWDRAMTVNLRSVHWLTNLVAPAMCGRGDGAIVLVASIAGMRGNKSLGIYSVSKAGLIALARNLAVEYGPHNVRVNAISPGLIRTDFARPLLDDDAVLARRLALTPLRRAGTPEEIAGVAIMLASKAGGFVTGHNLVVDGGTTIGDGN